MGKVDAIRGHCRKKNRASQKKHLLAGSVKCMSEQQHLGAATLLFLLT